MINVTLKWHWEEDQETKVVLGALPERNEKDIINFTHEGKRYFGTLNENSIIEYNDDGSIIIHLHTVDGIDDLSPLVKLAQLGI